MTEEEHQEIQRFMPFLDAVRTSGDNARRIIYVSLSILALTFFAVRNTTAPEWALTRYKVMLEASKCWLDWSENHQRKIFEKEEEKEKRCEQLLDIYKDLYFFAPAKDYPDRKMFQISNGDNLDDEIFKKRILRLMEHEVDHKIFSVPIFGASIDENDIWIVSGPAMLFMLILLHYYMTRDLKNLEQAQAECPNKYARDLLLMSHMLNVFNVPVTRIGWAGKIIRRCLIFFCRSFVTTHPSAAL